jgi:hypothetical protein
MLWAAGGASLLVPFAFAWLLRSSGRAARLLLVLAITVAASVFGLVLSFTTGRLAPVRILGIASMLAMLGWSWAYRECFRAEPLAHVVSRYTTVLFVVGAVSLGFAAFRAAAWDRFAAAASTGGPAGSAFLLFSDTAVGVAALSTARLRQLSSPYARSATDVLAWALLLVPFLGTLSSIYWIFAVRKREQLPAAQS